MSDNVFIKSLRIKDWLHVLGLPLLGILFASKERVFTFGSVLVFIVAALYCAHGYSVNNYFDLRYNRELPKRKFYALLGFSYSLFILNCAISYYCGGPAALSLVITGAITGFLYSAPPLRLKRSILFNLVLNSFGFALLFLIGFAAVRRQITSVSLAFTFFFGLLFIPLQLVHQISHSKEDALQGIPTLYNTHGPYATRMVFNASVLLIAITPLCIRLPRAQFFSFWTVTVVLCVFMFQAYRRLTTREGAGVSLSRQTRILFRKILVLYGATIAVVAYYL